MNIKHYCLVCGVSGCKSSKADAVYHQLLSAGDSSGLSGEVQIVKTGCFGLCGQGPILKILPDETLYVGVKPEDAEEIVKEHLVKGKPVERLMYKTPKETKPGQSYRKQLRLVLRNCGVIDPENIDEYIARRGYTGLEKALSQLKSEDIIEELKISGLRGRGGAGFPTGLKWQFTAEAEASQKYIVCNADEGDPGAYMDRAVLEGDPHSIIEAMTIAAKAVTASHGIIYIRAEYPLAISRLEIALRQAREYGLLGENILGSGLHFDIELRLGAGAFVCGEETALLASTEGKRGMPTPKPPFPAVKGLFGKPTVINNVETLANIPLILDRGGAWFKSIGTEKSPGTKVFALTGKIENSGLVEVAMGTTLREIVYDIGGGIRDGKKFKAVQTGGPSGGVITTDFLDTPIDFDSLTAIGSMMGSGGMIVMDESDCIVDVTQFYMEFCVDESCGKCAPCRIGTRRMQQILNRISKGTGTLDDIEKLKSIGLATQKASLCGLGQTAANPVLSTLKYFEKEYLEHIEQRKCRAGKCKDLVSYTIDAEKCIGCTVCARKCPVHCITGERKTAHTIDQSKCIKCGACLEACKFDAVKIA
ncbi:MAG: NADH-quinone oxidoreductase subunit F [Spirochaeta sp. LUC14_002_19_P3]|nr:MAG: NADH-quinone oxidoreductase subunit F [Spirochaeta sp. LUC14_002_19_P3]